jgi:putative phage-type endonuclease
MEQVEQPMVVTLPRERYYASKEEWLANRQEGIGGSEIAAVMGIDLYTSRFALWERKTGINTEPIPENAYMKAGIRLESAVVRYFEEESGYYCIRQPDSGFFSITHEKYPFLLGSRDRAYLVSDSGEVRILECKTTQKPIDRDALPVNWFSQLQWYMGLYGVSRGAIAWLERGIRFDFVEIDFDKDYFEYMVEQALQFWNYNVKQDVAPAELNADDIERLYPKEVFGRVLEASDKLMEDWRSLSSIKQQVKELEAQQEEIENRLKALMLDAERLEYMGMPLVTWKQSKSSMKFDEKAFAMVHPDLHKQFLVEKPGARRFLVK